MIQKIPCVALEWILVAPADRKSIVKGLTVWIRDPEDNWKSCIKHGERWFIEGWRAIPACYCLLLSLFLSFSVILNSILILKGKSLSRMFPHASIKRSLHRATLSLSHFH